MTKSTIDELFALANDPSLTEVGGAHNQKGIEYQRHWAILRMFELEEEGKQDFLFLFEAIQDIAVLDSETAPMSICLYQVKKKDRKEWTWTELTRLHPPKSGTTSKKASPLKPLSELKDSPLGKLYRGVIAFKQLKSSASFVSNAGCDLPLEQGGNVATSLGATLAGLSSAHLELLASGLEAMHEAGEQIADLSRISIEKTSLPATEPRMHLLGSVHQFLEKRSPSHAGQARSLVEALLAKVGPLGARTEKCLTFDQLRQQHGFSRAELLQALGELEEVRDVTVYLEYWLQELSQKGMPAREVMGIRMAANAIYRKQVMGTTSKEEQSLVTDCDNWLESNAPGGEIDVLLQAGVQALGNKYTTLKKQEITAYLAIRAILKCADLT